MVGGLCVLTADIWGEAVEDVVELGCGHGGGGESEDANRTLAGPSLYGPVLLPPWPPSTLASKPTRELSRSAPFANGLYVVAAMHVPLLTAITGSTPSSRQMATHP